MLNKILFRLDGNKTYLTGFFTVFGALFTLASQLLQHQPPDFNSAFGLIVPAIMLMCVRHGMQTNAQPGFSGNPDDCHHNDNDHCDHNDGDDH